MSAAGQVMPKLMHKQDGEQGQGEGKAADEKTGMLPEPGPGPEIAVAHHRRQAFEKVLHEARAVGRGGDQGGGEEQYRHAVFAEN